MPPILPRGHENGGVHEDFNITRKLENANCLLHVSGHCHWAFGLYFTSKKNIPCAVVSNCDSEWLSPTMVNLSKTVRGDREWDLKRGGYNIINFPIVCDIKVPGGPPKPEDSWILKSDRQQLTLSGTIALMTDKEKPSLIFFGPPSDPGTVERLRPLLSKYYTIDHFEDVSEAIEEVKKKETPYTICISKLGTQKNLGLYLIETIRKVHGNTTYIIVHSSTAAERPDTREHFTSKGVEMFVGHSNEMDIIPVIEEKARQYVKKLAN